MNNSAKYFANALLLSAVSVSMRAVAVSFNAYVTKKIGTEAVGLFTLVMSVYALAVTLASSGVNLAAVRITSEECARCDAHGITGREKRLCLKRNFFGCIKYSLFFGFISGVILYFSSDAIGTFLLSDARTVLSLRVLSFSLPPIALTSALSGFFTGLRKVWKNAVVSVSEQLVKIFLISALLVIIAPRGIEYACLAVVGGSAISEGSSLVISVLLYLADRTGKGEKNSPPSTDRRKKISPLKRAIGIAFPVACGSYVRQGLVCAEHLAIPSGLAASGTDYSAALSSYGVLHGMVFPLILFPASVIGAFASLLIPELSSAEATCDIKRIRAIASRAVRMCLCLSIGVAAVFMTFPSLLGEAVYSNEESGRYIALLAPLVPVMYLDTCVDSILKGIGQQVYCMKVNIIDASLSLLLVVTLVPRLGVCGYVICVFVTECVNASLSIGKMIAVTGIQIKLSWLIFPLCAAFIASSAAHIMLDRAISAPLCAAMLMILYTFALLAAKFKNSFSDDLNC